MFDKLDKETFEEKKAVFEAHTDKRKEVILRGFIHKNKQNPLFKEEITLARKYLGRLEI